MSHPQDPCPQPNTLAILLVDLNTQLESRIRNSIAHIATLRHVPGESFLPYALKNEPVGLIIVEAKLEESIQERVASHFHMGHNVPILSFDNQEIFTLIGWEKNCLRKRSHQYDWNHFPDFIQQMLSTASVRQEAFLLQESLSAVIATIQEGIIMVSNELIVRRVNATLATRCHFSTPALGSSLRDIKEGCLVKLVNLFQQVIDSRKAKMSTHIACVTSKSVELRLHVVPILDPFGLCQGATAILFDCSQTITPTPPAHNPHEHNLHRIIGDSQEMQKVYQLIKSLSDMDTTTLITGESGTGKELVAAALHSRGLRQHKPLVKVNCAALAEGVLESELFGHVKGAFTGAVQNRPGRFETASGGTIFLDEIGDIPPSMQTRLLRVLQERELERVGDSRTIKVDVRVIAATNKDLVEQVRLGKFREDLYFRLNVVEIALPPLRQRPNDILPLINHFIKKFNLKYSRGIVGVHDVTLELLKQYQWPGNIRELENTIEHTFVVCRQDFIRTKDLPKRILLGRPCADPVLTKVETITAQEQLPPPSSLAITPPTVTSPPPLSMPQTPPPEASTPTDTEKEEILKVLKDAQWKKKKAAKLLGMSRSTLYRKLEKYGIEL